MVFISAVTVTILMPFVSSALQSFGVNKVKFLLNKFGNSAFGFSYFGVGKLHFL